MTTSERPPQPSPPVPSDDEVPLFRTWPRIHGAVIAVALTVMALLALFSRWPF